MNTISRNQPLLGLRQVRADRQLSLRDISSLIGVSAVTVSRWERGCNSPHPLMLQAVAEGLGVTVETLMGVKNERANL